MPRRNSLSLKQKKYIDEYIANGGNGSQAALQAYDTNDPHTARQIAYENMTKPDVISYYNAKIKASDAKPEKVITLLLNELNSPEPVIRLKAAELLGKHLRMFSDKQADPIEVLEKVRAIGWGSVKEDVIDITPIQDNTKQGK